MKKLMLTCVIAAICLGLCSTVKANLTTSQTSTQSESSGTAVKNKSDDSGFFLGNWIEWLFDSLFGKDSKHSKYYYTNSGSGEYNSGDDSSYDSGDDGWNYDPGDDGWNYDPSDDGWNYGSGDDGSGGDPGTCPVQPIPAPGALVLGAIGSGLVTWFRRRRIKDLV